MAELISKALKMKGKMTCDGMTFYQKKGKTILRSSISDSPTAGHTDSLSLGSA